MASASDGAAEALAHDLMGLTAGIRRLVRRRVAQSMPTAPLPSAQVDLMLVVESEPGIGVAAAARALDLAANSVSALVNVLVRAGLMRRETDPDDRRAARLSLTPLATRRLARWRDARDQLVGGALGRVDEADQVAIEAALPALRRLLGELRTPARSNKPRPHRETS